MYGVAYLRIDFSRAAASYIWEFLEKSRGRHFPGEAQPNGTVIAKERTEQEG